ncbi:MAG: small-conductance mechanosensitive channel [Sulfurimonas sp.]|jgi:small-conductance mechanosensitive channel|uniref:mechanosensitive ion channel domain-containing protein n=1 Tax=Sulfurimonas sp. TaxID=2022749 RepID=UPI0039E5A412
MKKVFFLLVLSSVILFAEQENNTTLEVIELTQSENAQREEKIRTYISELDTIEAKISKEAVWMKSYASYMTSLDIRSKLDAIKQRIKFLKEKGRTISELDELNALVSKEKILASQIEKLKEKGTAPFSRLLTPPEIEESPEITNPLDIFTGISLIKTQNAYLNDYIAKKEELSELIILLRKENSIYEDIKKIDQEKKYLESLNLKLKQLKRFETALDTMSVTEEVYQKRLEIIEININKDIGKQVYRLTNIGIIILVSFFFFFLLKFIVKKYITDNERFYMANKIITFMNVTFIILVIFVNYIENVSHLVTILGFASAGIAIAMKDWFMSILGWLVLVFGGSIHVGDRIRVDMDGMQYVGDVMDISLLRMTLFEDITLTSVSTNRRAGRIIFIPNNYVFTRMIANYSHLSLKTVWDGVHITVTFDSNHKKAMHIAKEISRKYSKGYTDITRKQLNKLRSHYSLKNTNVEPRIFSFIEPNGVVIDAWYLTNAYATLTLRSVISTEIVEAYNKEDDITIAYPTQKLHIQNEESRTPPLTESGEIV